MVKRRLVVVGGSNVDISATSLVPLVAGDSNPGRVHTGLGGVGRNIAENLTRLGHDVSLIAAFGEDGFAELALSQAKRIGLDCSHAFRVPGGASCVYICVNGPDGDMAVAVNDMALCERITPAFLATRMDVVDVSDAVVVDANLSGEAIRFLAERCDRPLFADAVSTKKLERLRPVLPRLFGLKANRIETEALTGIAVSGEADLLAAARKLHGIGVRYVLVTLGAQGAFASDGTSHALMRPFPPPIRNATGCGDAFTAAAIAAILDNRPVRDVLTLGLAAANICGQSEEAVSARLTSATLGDFLKHAAYEEEQS